jgi:hypothetical protein
VKIVTRSPQTAYAEPVHVRRVLLAGLPLLVAACAATSTTAPSTVPRGIVSGLQRHATFAVVVPHLPDGYKYLFSSYQNSPTRGRDVAMSFTTPSGGSVDILEYAPGSEHPDIAGSPTGRTTIGGAVWDRDGPARLYRTQPDGVLIDIHSYPGTPGWVVRQIAGAFG